MQVDKRNRDELKQYFVKNAIPSEKNFAELIDGMMNQRDDGLVKLPNDPLCIEAAGDETSLKKTIHFYAKFADPDPTWVLSMNPRENPAKPATAKPGFSIGDAAGTSRLFIDRTSGNVGIGTITPAGKLEVNGAAVISDGSANSTRLNFMAAGSLAIGSTTSSYGGGRGWVPSTAGLLLETITNTEVAVHDSGTRVASFMYYEGDGNNRFTIGRDMGWGAISQITLNGNIGIGTVPAPRARLDLPSGGAYVGQYLAISYPSDGTNAAILNLYNETNKKFWHVTMRSGESDKLIFWRNDTTSYLPVLKLGMDGAVQIASSLSGGQTATGWTLGAGSWGPDRWLRLTTTPLGSTYHDLAVNSFWSAGSTRFDLAEVTMVRVEDQLEHGDAVVIDRENGLRVTRSKQPYDTCVYGIVSSYEQAAMVIGGFGGPEGITQAADKRPIALVGRVKVKASNENGAIRVGDLLTTSSLPGHLMRCEDPAKHPGAIVGKALSPSDGEKSFITALVTLQ